MNIEFEKDKLLHDKYLCEYWIKACKEDLKDNTTNKRGCLLVLNENEKELKEINHKLYIINEAIRLFNIK